MLCSHNTETWSIPICTNMDPDDNKIHIMHELGLRILESVRVKDISINCGLGLVKERARGSVPGRWVSSVSGTMKVEKLVRRFKVSACGTVEL